MGGDARKIGLSLASAGRLHVDFGNYQEAEVLLTEGLSLLESASELRGCGWCFNALGRLALFQGDKQLARSQFRKALCVNYELGYMIDIADGLYTLSVIEVLTGNVYRATLLRAVATTIKKRIGFTYPDNDPIFHLAPKTWLQTAPSSPEWIKGEILPVDQVVAYALGNEIE